MVPHVIVTEKAEKFRLKIEGVEVVTARTYLTDPRFANLKSARVFNLCKSYRYQSKGYYVSLLAMARKHRVIPEVMTIQDLKDQNIVKIFGFEIDDLIQRCLKNIKSETFVLSIFFGRNMAKSYGELAKRLFGYLKAPLLKAEFVFDGRWILKSLRAIPLSEIEEKHWGFLEESAREYFQKRPSLTTKSPKNYSYDLAIYYNPSEANPPSNQKALEKFIVAAKKVGLRADLITKDDSHRILEYDALFIRETTNVNHYTYKLSRKAKAEGLVVIDDPESILKCTNKVFLEELVNKHGIPRPNTKILHKDNIDEILSSIGLPCILKSPDSAFSQGVHKAETEEKFHELVETLMAKSDLIIVQEFLPSRFDWRIGVINNVPIYACKYFMALGHWQIYNNAVADSVDYDGEFETLPLEAVPKKVLDVAIKTSKLIGDGLYGLDIKEVDGKVVLIEINDNPNVDAGVEDQVGKDEIYEKIMRHFLNKLNRQRFIEGLNSNHKCNLLSDRVKTS